MKSKVYFIAVRHAEPLESLNAKLEKLLEMSKVLGFIGKGERVVVKMHFGEEGNKNFVRPELLRTICGSIKNKGGAAFLSDANTLYRGKRLNSQDHLKVAYAHGFTREKVGAEVVIPDDTRKEETAEVAIAQKTVKTAKIARLYIDTANLVVVSHFKGHILTGFGGALKNVGMGCATREGKLAQHCDVSPVVHLDQCIGCGECFKVCPAGAISIKNKKSVIEKEKCIGCASCMEACPTMAMFIDFGANEAVQEKIAEYSLAVLKNKKGKVGFINFAVRISKECDCWGEDNPMIGPDVGILASFDPVSLDHASFDVVVKACGRDIFEEAHPGKNGLKLLAYAEKIGLGNFDYELIEL